MKLHDMAGAWVPDDTETLEPSRQHCLSSNFFYMRKDKHRSRLNDFEFC